jgi:glutaredoxin
MDKKLILAAALLIAAVTTSVSVLILEKNGGMLAKNNSGQTIADERIILFYGDGCPHCLEVENFLDQSEASKKIAYETKEVWNNTVNRDYMLEIAAACGLTQGSIGVPFLWDGENKKCLMGRDQVTAFFQTKLNPANE